jgi:hydrogenase expression/formation protein HypC
MRVIEWVDEEGMLAWVERGEGDSLRREQVNMMLIGAQPVGTWILASLGLAKETVDDENRALIEDALSALDSSLDGNYDASRHFADLK